MGEAPNRVEQASLPEVLIGVGVLALAAFLAWGATGISSEAGYAGVGPNFLPWVVAVAALGAVLLGAVTVPGHRPLPAGPSQPDMMANLAFTVGLVAAWAAGDEPRTAGTNGTGLPAPRAV